MLNTLYQIARRLWPELETFDDQRRAVGVGNVFFFLYSSPLALAALIWLGQRTDVELLKDAWPPLLLLGVLMLIFSQLTFFTIVEIQPGSFATSDSSLSGLILWSALFLYGPTFLWLPVIGKTAELIWRFFRLPETASRWVNLRIYTLYLGAVVLTALVGLQFYSALGGSIPIERISAGEISVGFLTIVLSFLLFMLVNSGFIGYVVVVQSVLTSSRSRRNIFSFLVLALGLPFLSYPFGILAAGIYIQNSPFTFLFFTAGIFLVALLARRLSQMAEFSRQQGRQLEQLEYLARDFLKSSPDGSEITGILVRHVPLMFPSGRIVIWLAPDRFLLKHPADWNPDTADFWAWMGEQQAATSFLRKEELPWREVGDLRSPLVVAPIKAVESEEVIGAIYIELRTLVEAWDRRSLERLFPAVNALAAQVASAVRKVELYSEAIALERTAREIEFAGEIQASFLPDKIPVIPGWELAVTILPARQMSGDFFDFIPLENGNLGILIADVTDKGVGPALYMALSRTLIRTYAIEYEFEPETVFFAANGRILRDARARLFVTAFFAILDQSTGILTYSNAGHNPPYLVRAGEGRVQGLEATGMPIGIEENAVWEQHKIQLEPGDVLVLYTDGIPDTINERGESFEEERLIEIVRENLNCPAHEIQAQVIDRIYSYMGNAAQVDDITLMILARQEKAGS